MDKKQIHALTATRGFAALLIVVFHFGLNSFPFTITDRFFSKGNLAVSYFFTLSGFIMAYTYSGQQVGYAEYLRRRIARIVPLYLFALLLTVVTIVYDVNVNGTQFQSQFWLGLLLNALFLQAYIPGYALLINSPGWSLSAEMFFYFLFPLLLWLYSRYHKRFAVMVIVLYCISQVFHLAVIDSMNPAYGSRLHEFIYYHPLMHLNEFMMGIAGFILFQQVKINSRALTFLVFALMVVAVMYIPWSKHNGLLAPLYMLFIICVANSNSGILNSRALVYLGEISYGIYILQMPVFYVFSEISKKILPVNEGVYFICYVVVLISLSALCYKYIEQPLRRKINSF